jgi:hypothetical protein
VHIKEHLASDIFNGSLIQCTVFYLSLSSLHVFVDDRSCIIDRGTAAKTEQIAGVIRKDEPLGSCRHSVYI